MAQDFEGSGAQITNSATTLLTANSDDALVGIRLANVLTSAVTVSVFVDDNGSGTLRYIVKDLALPASSSVELVQGGSKIVMQNGDVLKAQSGTANGFDCWVSRVDAISE